MPGIVVVALTPSRLETPFPDDLVETAGFNLEIPSSPQKSDESAPKITKLKDTIKINSRSKFELEKNDSSLSRL
jgi:hypothetical protein